MNIQKNAFVSLAYELRTEGSANGPLVEKITTERPMNFVFGIGTMLPIFEQHLEGLKTGDDFQFILKPDEAYGEYRNDAVVNIPKDVFVVDGELRSDLLKIGNTVPMIGEGEQRVNGRILNITDTEVKMDFNSPLAGETLYFSGKIIEVREATAEEINQTSHCSSCGGGCGSNGCGSNGCGGCH